MWDDTFTNPFLPNNMAEQDDKSRDRIPMWDGQASTLDTFAEDVDLYVAGLREEQIILAGARIARAHPPDSAQRKLAT